MVVERLVPVGGGDDDAGSTGSGSAASRGARQQLTQQALENARPRRHEPIPYEEFPADPDYDLSCTGWGGLCFRVGFFVGILGVGWSFRGTKAAVGSGG